MLWTLPTSQTCLTLNNGKRGRTRLTLWACLGQCWIRIRTAVRWTTFNTWPLISSSEARSRKVGFAVNDGAHSATLDSRFKALISGQAESRIKDKEAKEMGLFDKMFGRGASAAQQDANAQQRFNELKGKYQSVLNLIEQQQVQLLNLHVQDNKLFIKGTASSDAAKDAVWNQIKLVDSDSDKDLICDISVDASRAAAAVAGGGQGQGGQVYEVKPGDNLSKISKQF